MTRIFIGALFVLCAIAALGMWAYRDCGQLHADWGQE